MTKHIVYNKNANEIKHDLKEGSVQLVVTSPPYWNIKDYGTPDQIGYYDTYEEYIDNLVDIWTQCYHVLSPGCKLCINIGDQYMSTKKHGRYEIMPIHADTIVECRRIGFDLWDTIIWQKFSTYNPSGGGSVAGSYPTPRDGVVKKNFEYILIFKKPGKTKPADRMSSALSLDEWKTYFDGTWNIKGERQKEHIAMYPVELPRRLIKMYSFIGEVVLDPFLGSGTTSLAAKELERNSIGYEINPDYIDIILKKVGDDIEVRK